jgi:uncharacterized membrane protein YcaP (DUF421 family)
VSTVFRAAAIYVVLLILFRLAGRRTIAQLTSFDLVLVMIVSEGASQGLTGQDHSVTNALLVATTLITLDVGLGWLKARYSRLDAWLEGGPVILVDNGRPLEDRMRRARVDREDILAAAREAWPGAYGADQVRRIGKQWRYLHRSARIPTRDQLSAQVEGSPSR